MLEGQREACKRRTEAPVNGGRNYKLTAVVTLKNSAICWKLRVSSTTRLAPPGSDNVGVRTISRKDSQGFRCDVPSVAPEIGYYLAGFADGEGSFNVTFRKRGDYRGLPWKISLCFNVSQRDEKVLRVFQRELGCGSMRMRADGVWYFEVNDLEDITHAVIPFFERFGFLSEKKQRDFRKFKELAVLLRDGSHRTYDGLREVLRIRSDMNDGGAKRRKYADEAILEHLRESSEATR